MPVSVFNFSILIPTLGRKTECLLALLSSIAKQDYEKSKYEVLLIQNGDFPDIDRSVFNKQFSNLHIEFCRTNSLGINTARSFGLTKARGVILLMLDDDVILPDTSYLSRLWWAHKNNPEVLALGGSYQSLRKASLLDRIYNLDAHLSLRSSQRGRYSVDLLGGCVSYKKSYLDRYALLPNSNLLYGATETEFHHRLFRAGAILKYQYNLSVYHNPQMTFVEYCKKAYRQGHGFSRYCFYKSGAKKNVSFGWKPRLILSIRELFYSWGSGEIPFAYSFRPIQRAYGYTKSRIIQFFSNIKWASYRCYANYLSQKINKRIKHYGSSGTFFLGANSTHSFSLRSAWTCGQLESLANGLGLLKELLVLDVAKIDKFTDLSYYVQKYSHFKVALYCSNNLLTPLEIKRNVERATSLLQQAKYKYKLNSVVLIEHSHIEQWPEPRIVHQGKKFSQRLKFSIIIPFYNNSLFLKRVMQSLCEQNYSKEKYEIVLVSDGSSADHVRAVQDFVDLNQHTSISIIQWEKSSKNPKEFRAGMARQLGSMFAAGEYLSFLDSDIIVQSDYLLELEKGFSVYNIIQAKRRMLNEESTALTVQGANHFSGVYKEEEYWETFKNNKDWETLWAYWKYTCTYSLSLKRRDFFELGGFRPQYNQYGFEDVDLGFRAYLGGLRFGYSNSDVFHLYPQGLGAIHHFNAAKREALLVSSCETFYRLNLSPALYKEFEFFLRGRNFNYQSLKARDYVHLTCWKDYFHSVQHYLRQYSARGYWSLVRAYGHSYVFFSKVYYHNFRPILMKPYYFTRYQCQKYALLFKAEKDVQSELAKERN